MNAATATFPAVLAAAQANAAKAAKALRDAHEHVIPATPEWHALFITNPIRYAECLRKMADILMTLPELEAAASAADAALAPLVEQACWKCDGTGKYAGPTNATRQGVPYCFTCDGHGRK